MTKHVIELNGKKYDAVNGTPISEVKKTKSAPAKNTGPKHLDGFTRRPAAQKVAGTTHAAVHAKPAKSQTLMRTAVKRPANTKITAKAAPATPAVHKAVASKPVTSVKPSTAIRAQHVAKSSAISKFGKVQPEIKTTVLPVAAPPAPAQSARPAIAAAPAAMPPTPAPAIAPPASVQTKQTAPKLVAHDPFKAAIEQSVSHNQPHIKKPKLTHRVAKRLHVSPRVVSASAVFLALFTVGGTLAYQNMPELAMRIASARAGLNASLPSYQPAGFSLSGPIEYDHGEVKVSYKSNSDDRQFKVIQKNSSWNSETLLENYIAPNNQPYQTFQANGRTIYIYDGNKATWVDGGVWYNVDGKADLTSDQLLRIADSL